MAAPIRLRADVTAADLRQAPFSKSRRPPRLGRMGRHELTDAEWQRLEPLLPPHARTGRPPKERGTIIDALPWLAKTGAPWRDLPERFGSWRTDRYDKMAGTIWRSSTSPRSECALEHKTYRQEHMANLYMHIGMPKAGSTSIQAAFVNSRERLAEHGVGYFGLGQNHSGVLRSMFDANDKKGLPGGVSKVLGVQPRSTDFDRAALSELFDRALTADPRPKLVMSGEGLFQFQREPIARMKEHLSRFFEEIRIIAYVRDPASWASSRAQNAIKKGTSTLDQICDPAAIAERRSVIVPSYRAGLERYIDVFGRQAVDIRVFDRSRLIGGDLIADFCAAIDEPGLAPHLSVSVMNPSLSYEAILLIDEYKKLLATKDGQVTRAGGRCRGVSQARGGLEGTRFILPKETLERVRAAVVDDVAWLREIMKEDVFGEPDYPPEATTGPAWSRATLRQLVGVIEGGSAQSTAPVKRDREKKRQAVEAVAGVSGKSGKVRDLPEATIRQLQQAFSGFPESRND